MSALREHLHSFSAAREETLAALAQLGDAELVRPVTWRDGRFELRYLLLRLADDDEERGARLCARLGRSGWRPSEAQRILADAVTIRGRLLAALVPLADDQLDAPPAPGEWSVRQVVGHILNTARRYTLQSRHAADRVARGGEGPVRPPESILPPLTPQGAVDPEGAAAGSLTAVRRELAAVLAASLDSLAPIPDEHLTAPAIWAGVDVDLRFRLHRFAAHEREHVVQLLKTLQALAVRPSEAQLILGEAEQARVRLVALTIGLPDDIAAHRPNGTDRSVLDLLDQAVHEERAQVAAIQAYRA